MVIAEIEDLIERWAPPGTAMPGDPIGHQLGDRRAEAARVAVALDPGLIELDEAAERGCELMVCHHPLIYRPIASATNDDPVGDLVWRFARAGVALFVAHTNWDAAEGGINDALAERLGLLEIAPLRGGARVEEVKVVVFTPPVAQDALVDALAAAGAGEIGLYRRCAFTSEGRGTFEPQPGARPTIGSVGEREVVDEARLEMRARRSAVPALINAIRSAHPYEEPAFDVYPLMSSATQAVGRVGLLAKPVSTNGLAEHVGKALRTQVRVASGVAGRMRRVAVVGGAGSEFVGAAKAAGAQALVTGDVKHHHLHDARFHGIALLEAGHAATEQPGVEALAKRLSAHFGERLDVISI